MHARTAARDVARRELSQRALRTLRPALLLSGACPAGSPFGRLRKDQQLGNLLASVTVLIRAGLFGALDDQVNATRALRIPGIGLICFFGFGPLLGMDPADPRPALEG